MEKQTKHAAIVLAAGKGSRMNSNIPKQFLNVNGKPLICYALQAMQDSFIDEIILVTSEGYMDYCKEEIVNAYGFTKVKDVVCGGKERYDSVYKGICAVPDADYLYIHDGARPILTEDILVRAKECVEEHKTAIAGVPTKDTIKVVNADGLVIDTPDRSTLWNVQTPQAFDAQLIREAYEKMYAGALQKKIAVTDDAMLVEKIMQQPVVMFHGAYTNIKVTTPEDVYLTELFLKK